MYTIIKDYNKDEINKTFNELTVNAGVYSYALGELGVTSENELLSKLEPAAMVRHVLQRQSTSDQILDIFKNTSDIVITCDAGVVSVGQTEFIALTAYGIDLCEQIMYAYMIIDRCIPPCFRIREHTNNGLTALAFKKLEDFVKSKNGNFANN